MIQKNKNLENLQKIDVQHNILPDNDNNQNYLISTNNVHTTNNFCNFAKIYQQILKKCINIYRLLNKDLETCVEFF